MARKRIRPQKQRRQRTRKKAAVPGRHGDPSRRTLSARSRLVRPLQTPSVKARTQLHATPDELSVVHVRQPGTLATRMVVPTREVSAELVQRLKDSIRDPPRLRLKAGQGAVDIKL